LAQKLASHGLIVSLVPSNINEIPSSRHLTNVTPPA
jgi:hypothetical protein